jgi:CubicO group peptidase (beta-lactamase class C family)
VLARAPLRLSQETLRARVARIVNSWPAVGLAVGVVSEGGLEFFEGHGLADIASNTPVTDGTIFRIASVTKTFTAVAAMQLVERGLLDLDAPANDYLRAFRLVPADPRWRPATPRHLLTHTAGIRELLHLRGLVRMRDLGETMPAGRPLPALAAYYCGGLRIDAEPGSRFMYTNHGFNTLGQVVEDVSGMPLARYLREQVFEPLGMTETDLDRSRLEPARLATGYELRSHGAEAVADYDVISKGAGGIRSSPRDVARYLAALLGGGANEHGSVLKPATVAAMFEPQYQPDPRIPGMGLAFFRHSFGGRQAVEHDGILPGFDSQVYLAPEDGIAVLAFANGAKRGMHWLGPHVSALLRELLGVAEERIRTDLAQRPELWSELCGRYSFSAARTDPASLVFGLGAEVLVRRGELTVRFLSPIPALIEGFALHPDDARDPYVFRAAFPWFGIGTTRVVFTRVAGQGTTALHLEVGPMSFAKRP